MCWSYARNAEGREVGYGVVATCDELGCIKKIDRGLAYACGGMHDGGDQGCGKYFCGKHLFFGGPSQLCNLCFDAWIQEHPEADDNA